MIEKLIQRCEKCGWVMPLNKNNVLICAKCGHKNIINTLRSHLKLEELDKAFMRLEDNGNNEE